MFATMTLVWVLLGRIYLVIHTRQHLWRCGGVVLGYAFAIILFRRRACFRPPEYPSFRQVRVGISGGFCIQAPSHGNPHPDVLRTRPIHSSFYPPLVRTTNAGWMLSLTDFQPPPAGVTRPVCQFVLSHRITNFRRYSCTNTVLNKSIPSLFQIFQGEDREDLQESMCRLATHTGRYPVSMGGENSISNGENRRVYGVYSTDC